MTARDAAPLTDWLEPLVSDSDFPERTAEIGDVLDVIGRLCDEIERHAESDEVLTYIWMLRDAVFGPHTGIEYDEVGDDDPDRTRDLSGEWIGSGPS